MVDLQLQIEKLVRIGVALSSEHNIDRLLEMIVDEARGFTHADAGTLYVMGEDGQHLDWKIVHNETMGTRVGGTSDRKVVNTVFPPVPLVVNGRPNEANVCAHVANTGQTVNIPDVYEAEGFDFTGTRAYDARTGYRCRSMLVVALRNHEDDIIGVLQLINARDPDAGHVIAFPADLQDLVSALASQAAVGITTARLIHDLEHLFDAFIQATAAAIDEKSPYTAGHVRRVADLTMRIAAAVNASQEGPLSRTTFTPEELNELRIAAWLHDVGKITTPEYVVDKATKLETIFDRVETLRTRWALLAEQAETAALKRKLSGEAPAAVDEDLARQKADLADELAFLERCNTGGEAMADADLARIKAISERTYQTGGCRLPCLTENEVKNLSIRKGTLTNEERAVINNHAAVSIKMLSQLPFSKSLRRVPEIAGGHHEKLNGKGYPRGLSADQLPLQSRILAVADVFEALTASDRPYRKPMPLSQALKIIGFMVKDGELDERVVALMREAGIVHAYAKDELRPEQIDV